MTRFAPLLALRWPRSALLALLAVFATVTACGDQIVDPELQEGEVVQERVPVTTPNIIPGAGLDDDSVDIEVDVCPFVYDPEQIDSDGDGVGDACLDVRGPATVTTQAELDALSGVTAITTLIVRGADIVDLSPLSSLVQADYMVIQDVSADLAPLLSLRRVARSLIIFNPGGSDPTLADLASLELVGSLNLLGFPALRDLSGLSALRAVDQVALRDAPVLESIALPVRFVRDWALGDLPALTTLEGLTEPDSIQNLSVRGAASLTDLQVLTGLSGTLGTLALAYLPLATIPSMPLVTDVTGFLELRDLPTVTSLDLLPGLRTADLFVISGLPVSDLSPLASIGSIGHLALNSLTGVSDLSPLAGITIGELNLGVLPLLTSLEGTPPTITRMQLSHLFGLRDLDGLPVLPNLTGLNVVRTGVQNVDALAEAAPGSLSFLRFQLNGNLSDLRGLSGVSDVDSLRIIENSALTSLDGLGGTAVGSELILTDNSALFDCSAIQSEVVKALSNLVVGSNAPGCNSIAEILASNPVPDISGLTDPIVFASTRDGNEEIYAVSGDGSGTVRLTDDPGRDFAPVLSPDRTRVAFVSWRDGNAEIYLMDLADGSVTNLTQSPSNDFYPAWSPDGSLIAFQSNRSGDYNLYTMAPDGTGVIQITALPNSEGHPSWSPDGTQLAFQSEATGWTELYVADADGSNVRQVTSFDASIQRPEWSPDGNRIVFSSNHEGVSNQDLYTIRVDGSGLTRLTTYSGDDRAASWLSDATRIVFQSNRIGGTYQLFAIDPDGSNVQRITTSTGTDYDADWRYANDAPPVIPDSDGDGVTDDVDAAPDNPLLGEVSFPEFQAIAAGYDFSCGLTTSGTLQCWGENGLGQAQPPSGSDFVQVSAGADYGCAVRTNGTAVCWGNDASGQASPPPSGVGFRQVSAGQGGHSCGLDANGSLSCWGADFAGSVSGTPAGSNWVDVSAGSNFSCALDSVGRITCWGYDAKGQTAAPIGRGYIDIDAGGEQACAIRWAAEEREVECWGTPDTPPATATVPAGYGSISAGLVHSCSVDGEGGARCAGIDGGTGRTVPPTGYQFTQVSAGGTHTCGLSVDHEFVCWGADDAGQSTPSRVIVGNLVISAQEHLDTLTGVTRLEGSLRVQGAGITDLSPLSRLTDVVGDLFVVQTPAAVDDLAALRTVTGELQLYGLSMNSLAPLGGLTEVGQLSLYSMQNVADLTGLPSSLQLDAFFANGPIESLSGLPPGISRLTLQSTAVADLVGVTDATSLDYVELVGNPSLTSLGALAGVTTLSRLILIDNPGVTALGFPSLVSVGDIAIRGMDGLTDLAGLDGVTQVTRSIMIEENASLGSLSGLAPAGTMPAGLTIRGNPVLNDISALSGLTAVWGITIDSNPALTSLVGLDGITGVGNHIAVVNNAALATLDGLTSFADSDLNRHLWIRDNASLTDISRLQSLSSIGGDLAVTGNLVLPNLNGLQGLSTVAGDLTVRENPALSSCSAIQALLAGLAVGGITTVELNAFGCNSTEEIVAGYTETGIPVTPVDATTGSPAATTLTFETVTSPGETTVTSGTVGGPGAPTAPDGAQFRLGIPASYFEITTTATFTGAIEVCIDYSGVSFGNESKLEIQHDDGTGWAPLEITSHDTTNDVICGLTYSLSPFIVVEPNEAPAVSAIALPADPVSVGSTLDFSALFTDANPFDTHTGTFDWGAGPVAGTVTESDGSGTVDLSRPFDAPGVYSVEATVSDGDLQGSRSSLLDEPAYIVVYDPSGSFVTGGGWIDSPAGACTWGACTATTTGKANFGFVSKYRPGASTPTGETQFRFKAGELDFESTQYEWLVVAGGRAQFKGIGEIAGQAGYGFMLTGIDGDAPGGQGVDRFRIKIWELATDTVVYDNQRGADDTSDASSALGGGSIQVHR